jgi:hypothetical protein
MKLSLWAFALPLGKNGDGLWRWLIDDQKPTYDLAVDAMGFGVHATGEWAERFDDRIVGHSGI